MTREEVIKALIKERKTALHENKQAFDMAIKALEQQPSEDCVSRQAVLEKINDWWGITSTSGEPTICDYIRELPPVTPTQSSSPAIPLDKVKQAREEIDDLDRHYDNDYFSSNRDAMFKCNEVLEILDKLLESEDEG